MLRVLLAGGGTAGHVNPALAIAEIIKKHYPDAEISFAGNPEKLEARLVPAAGYKFYPIKIEGFQRKPNWVNLKRNIHAAGCLVKSGSTAKKIIKEAKPDLVIGTGGYVSGPIVRKAAKMGIKTAIHEQNAFPGVTNKILAKSADVVMLTVKEAEKYMPENAKTVVTGLPVRGAFNTMSKSEAKKQLGFDENEICVLSTGGSLGARVLNENIAKLLKWYQDNDVKVCHIHSKGQSTAEYYATCTGFREKSYRGKRNGCKIRSETAAPGNADGTGRQTGGSDPGRRGCAGTAGRGRNF